MPVHLFLCVCLSVCVCLSLLSIYIICANFSGTFSIYVFYIFIYLLFWYVRFCSLLLFDYLFVPKVCKSFQSTFLSIKFFIFKIYVKYLLNSESVFLLTTLKSHNTNWILLTFLRKKLTFYTTQQLKIAQHKIFSTSSGDGWEV